jgi:hypothetical protein
MPCPPAANVEIESDAPPPFTAEAPSTVAPSRNCTLPVAEFGETAAVKVTASPTVDVAREELKLVVVRALATGRVRAPLLVR